MILIVKNTDGTQIIQMNKEMLYILAIKQRLIQKLLNYFTVIKV